jgi:general secretion pathway protein D
LIGVCLLGCIPNSIQPNVKEAIKGTQELGKFIENQHKVDNNMSRDEIREAIQPAPQDKPQSSPEFTNSAMPEFSPVIWSPDPPEIKDDVRVSLSVSEDVDVKDVLIELARLAELELALDTQISNRIILSVQNRPLNEVLDTVAELAGLRYVVKKGMLKVMRDSPYLVNYNVDYINLIRSSSSTVNTQTQVLGGGGGEGGGGGGGGSGGGGLNSGSSNTITASYEGDLWKSIEQNLNAILAAELAKYGTTVAPPTPTAPVVAVPVITPEVAAAMGPTSTVPAPQLPATPAAPTPAPAVSPSAEEQQQAQPSVYYTINRSAGIISVMAGSRKHKEVRKYLDKVKMSMSAQVLIEAKIVEVELNEEYATGIDWGKLTIAGMASNFNFAPNLANFMSGVISSGNSQLSKEFLGSERKVIVTDEGPPEVKGLQTSPALMSNVIKMLEGFGVTRALSNPRLVAMNNQQAVLNFAKNHAYYSVKGDYTPPTTTGGTTTAATLSVQSELHTVPIGIMLNIQPSINLSTQEITMNIRPTISKLLNEVEDPAVSILRAQIQATGDKGTAAGASISSKAPVVGVREMDTVLKVKSGDVMVIGGLLTQDEGSSEVGVPFVSRIPVVGNLFKKTQKTKAVKETVILMQATIVTPNGYHHEQDRKLYEKFTSDPRPLNFN